MTHFTFSTWCFLICQYGHRGKGLKEAVVLKIKTEQCDNSHLNKDDTFLAFCQHSLDENVFLAKPAFPRHEKPLST